MRKMWCGSGNSSCTARRSLPSGAKAMTVEFADGGKMAFKQNNDALMNGVSIEDRFLPVMKANAELHPGRGAAGIPTNGLLHRERKRRG